MSAFRIVAIEMEGAAVPAGHAAAQECEVAINDLLESNEFRFLPAGGGPYRLTLRLRESRLLFLLSLSDGSPHGKVALPLTPFRRLIKDYFLLCDSYYKALRAAPPAEVESLDMGRRALHDEGGGLLRKQLVNKIEMDFDTARRLFTLICALHMKG